MAQYKKKAAGSGRQRQRCSANQLETAVETKQRNETMIDDECNLMKQGELTANRNYNLLGFWDQDVNVNDSMTTFHIFIFEFVAE